eukprot:43266_1
MAFLVETQEGIADDSDVDLSKFKDIVEGLKSLQMFDSYFVAFKTNNVNDKAVCCLEKDDVKELIPKIGDRARFMQWLKQYNRSLSSSNTKVVNTDTNQNAQKTQIQKKEVIEYIQCSKCNGKGTIGKSDYNASKPYVCDNAYCKGRGYWDPNPAWKSDQYNTIKTCPSCQGSGKTAYGPYYEVSCSSCLGAGKVKNHQK